MIAFVSGTIEEITEDNTVLSVGGIGINVRISPDTAARLPGVGAEVKLYTYTSVKEDSFQLFGFLSRSALEIFKKCITVNGIGPKGALSILSVLDADSLRFAILSGDAKAISRAPGIGARTAERLILELKDKLSINDTMIQREIDAGQAGAVGSPDTVGCQGAVSSVQVKEAVEALVALGYGRAESMKAVSAIEGIEAMDSGAVLKAALKKMF